MSDRKDNDSSDPIPPVRLFVCATVVIPLFMALMVGVAAATILVAEQTRMEQAAAPVEGPVDAQPAVPNLDAFPVARLWAMVPAAALLGGLGLAAILRFLGLPWRRVFHRHRCARSTLTPACEWCPNR